MKFFAVLMLCVVAAMARPDAPLAPIEILRSDIYRHDSGEYSLDVETADGTSLSQRGSLHEGEEGKVVVVSGSFKYIGDDGLTYTVSYTADENGFQPQAAHLPVAPIDPHHL